MIGKRKGRIMKGNRMRNTTIMVLIFSVCVSIHVKGEVPPGIILLGKEAFASVYGEDADPEEITPYVRHDMELFRKIVKDNKMGKVGQYFVGLLKWIEENGDESYLPFLEEIIADMDYTDPGKYSSEYLDRYYKMYLYIAATEIWFKIKTKGMSEEEKVDLIIESLKKDSGIPKVQGEVWRQYEKQLAAKRDKIYDILLNGEINEDYFGLARGINIWGLFELKGLSPTKDEVNTIMGLEGRDFLKSSMISYFMDKRDTRYLDIFVPYIMEQYRKAETYRDMRRYDNMLYMYMTGCGTDKETSAKIQKMIIDKMRKHPEPWNYPFSSEELFEAFWLTVSIANYPKKEHMTEETKTFLKQYRDAIRSHMGAIFDEKRESELRGMLKNLNKALGEPANTE